jgi:radical SAM protein with 4Fe4S-binding SPASM domain
MSALIRIKQKLSRSKIFNKFLQILPKKIFLLYPLKHITIEPTNLCNLRCLFCTQSISSRPKGIMGIKEFKKIVSLLPGSIKEIQFHFAGEPVLNKDLPEMIRIIKEKNIRTSLSSNGNVPIEKYEAIIKAGLDILIISLDGATKESYEKYRRGGSFDIVTKNIKKMSGIPGRKTKIVIQFLVMGHNENQIEEIKKLARDLGVDTLWLKSASLNIGCSEILENKIFENAKLFLPGNPKYSRYSFENGNLLNKDKPLSCPWVFRTVIMWNGDVGICCADLEGKVVAGNILKENSFDKIWRSKKYHQIRRAVLRRDLAICKNCSVGDNPVKETIKFV